MTDRFRILSLSGGGVRGVFSAAGLGELPATAARMAQHIPALWIIGTDDPLHERGETFAYARAPLHPASRYATVKADRKGTPDAAVKTVAEWIKSQE